MISARYASCWKDVRAATRRSSSARSVANKRIRVRRGLDRGMCEGTFGISHYNRRASASIPYLQQPTGRTTSDERRFQEPDYAAALEFASKVRQAREVVGRPAAQQALLDCLSTRRVLRPRGWRRDTRGR